MIRKLLLSLLFVLLALEAFAPANRIQAGSSAPSPYDLIDIVNGYRAANGLYALDSNSLVMAAAQAHADWIVETGNGGHTGAGGSDETVRVAWTGYGGGAQIHCDEGWASGTNAEDVVYSSWADWVHQGVMLDYWGNGYTDVGAGVSDQGNGRYVFVLDVCMVSGKPSTKRPTAVNTPVAGDEFNGITDPTSDTSQLMFTVVKSTPEADGSVIHTVQYGQSLVQIALAYGTKVNEIRQLNNIAEDFDPHLPGTKVGDLQIELRDRIHCGWEIHRDGRFDRLSRTDTRSNLYSPAKGDAIHPAADVVAKSDTHPKD